MRQGAHRTRILLFLAAVLLPSSVLVATSLRLIRQERELAARRQAEARTLEALQLGRILLESLERTAEDPRDSALLVVARLDGTRLLLPWEDEAPGSGRPPAPPDFQRALRLGESAEFATVDFPSAARHYQAAVELAPDSLRRAEALLRWARTLRRSGETAQAKQLSHQLASLPPELVDEEGMPFTLYGMEGLLGGGAEPREIVPPLTRALKRIGLLDPSALFALEEISTRAMEEDAPEGIRRSLASAREQVRNRLAVVDRLLDLQAEFSSVLALASASSGTSPPGTAWNWVPFGDEPWMVGVPRQGAPGKRSVPVVQAQPLLHSFGVGGTESAEASSSPRILPLGDRGGDPLGPGLGGLRVSMGDSPLDQAAEGRVEGWFFSLFLPLILALTLFTAYLAWRDVRRETVAAELRSKFVSSVSHELKTPLTSIRMFAETLAMGRALDPEARAEYLETIVHETERLSRLINNVLDFSRIDREEKRYTLQPVDLGDVVDDALQAMAHPLSQEGFDLEVEIQADLPMVEGDRDALTQALLNLLSNALKFSGEGRYVRVTARREGTHVCIAVADRGPGIDPQEQGAIFQDFYRSPTADADGIPGTGLGLALVAHVARGHGGSVALDSVPGEGSTFTLRLPILRQETGP